MKIHLFVALAIFTIFSLSAQEQIKVDKKSYTNAEGDLYWNKAKPVYLRISDTPDGQGQLLNSKKSEAYVNPMYLDTEGLNYIRSRYAVDPNTKDPVRPEQEVLFEIYADGSAPSTTFNLTGARQHAEKDTIFYGPNLVGSIEALDKYAGVSRSMLSVNGKPYVEYKSAVDLQENGAYNIKFYSEDHVGNQGEVQEDFFVVDTEHPSTFYNINGLSENKVIGKSTKIYLQSEDNLSKVSKTYYRFDDETFKVYSGKEVSFSYLADGNHTLYFYSEDNVGNKEPEQSFDFYFDKSAPIMAADVLGDRFVANDVVYFSGRTKLKLTAVDNRAGVKEILYSIDGGEFASYKDPFYLPSVSGEHIIRFYSLDFMNNSSSDGGSNEYKHNVNKVYVDLTGPKLSHKYVGPTFKVQDTLFIAPTTKIELRGTDAESKLKYLSYSIDGAIEETTYDKPFSIQKPGWHELEMFGYDNVNNRNIGNAGFVVDAASPEIIANFSAKPLAEKDGVKVYPAFSILYLAANDKETGADKIWYTINGGKKTLYQGVIQNFKSGKEYNIKVFALDKLGNESETELQFRVE